MKVVAEMYKWLNETFMGRNIGYLIHLDASHREFGFCLCIDQEVPFYYPWLPAYKTMPWLHRFDPDSLGIDPNKPGLPPAADFSPYDQCLQDVLELDNKQLIYIGCSGKLPTLSTLRDGPGADFDRRRCIPI